MELTQREENVRAEKPLEASAEATAEAMQVTAAPEEPADNGPLPEKEENRPTETDRPTEDGQPAEDAEGHTTGKLRMPVRLTRGQPPKLDRRSVAWMLIITLVYAMVAFFRLGTTAIPQTGIYLDQRGQSVTVQLNEPTEVSYFCFYKWRGRKNDITIETRQSLDDQWAVAYGPKELSSHMRWKNLKLETDGPVEYIRITFKGKEIKLAEVVVLDKNGERIGISAPVSLNQKLNDKKHLDNLTDEQALFDEDSTSLTFAYFDEYLYALTSHSYIHGGTGLENTHPVLGKVVMELGIRIFGMNSIGWRIFGTLSGILMLPVMFFLARRVLKSNRWALVATYLMAVECMHYTQTRLATIDSFPLLFILLAYLNLMKYYQAEDVAHERGPLFCSGLCFGLACAFKWIGAYAGLGLAICFFLFFAAKARDYRAADEEFSVVRYTLSTFACCVLFFVVVPVAVYVASYMPVAFGRYDEIKGWKGIWDNQLYMWNFHSTLEQTFDFSSKWWGWPLMIGAFSTYTGTAMSGMKARIMCLGNPLIWWVSVPAVLFGIWHFFRGRRVKLPLLEPDKQPFVDRISAETGVGSLPSTIGLGKYDAGLLMAVVAYLCQYVPWMLVTRECFIYHYFASAEISILVITFALRVIERKFACGKKLVWGYCIAAGVLFVVMFPILNGFYIPAELMKIFTGLLA